MGPTEGWNGARLATNRSSDRGHKAGMSPRHGGSPPGSCTSSFAMGASANSGGCVGLEAGPDLRRQAAHTLDPHVARSIELTQRAPSAVPQNRMDRFDAVYGCWMLNADFLRQGIIRTPARTRPDKRGARGHLLRPAGLGRPHRNHHAEAGPRHPETKNGRVAVRKEPLNASGNPSRGDLGRLHLPDHHPRRNPGRGNCSPRTRTDTRSRTTSRPVITSSPGSRPSLPPRSTRPSPRTSP